MARLLIVFGLFAFVLQVQSATKNDQFSIVRLTPTKAKHVETLRNWKYMTGRIFIVKPIAGFNDTLDVAVPADHLKIIQDYAVKLGLGIEVTHHDSGDSEDIPERIPRRRVLRSFDIFGYNSYAAMQEFLETTARTYPHLVQLQTLGNSYQGRKMQLCKISAQPNNGNPIIFIDAGIHSREWVAPAMALYIIHRLTTDPSALAIGGELAGVDWYILPMVNPDGYEYTRSSKNNRLWRKTRSKNGNCFGVDGNRNYGYKWAVSGVSSDPCHKETFAGPRPFSEPETQMVRNVMMDNAKRMKLYVSLHAYGQYLVYPWGYTGDFLPKEWRKLDTMAKAVSYSVQKAGGKPFKVLSAGKWYPAAGGSDDFAFGAVGVPYSYTMELTDGYDFVFPEKLLRIVLPQYYEGFRTFGLRIRNEFGRSKKSLALPGGFSEYED